MIPYVYFLFNKTTNQKYIGSKYARNSDPNLFWVEYFTSSHEVKKLIEKYGVDDFSFSIRKTFSNAKDCLDYETKLLRKINAAKRKDFLNKHNNDNSNVKWNKEKRKKASKKLKNSYWVTNGLVDLNIKCLNEIPKNFWRGRTVSKGGWYGKRSKEFCKNISERKSGVPLSEKHKKSLIGLKRGMSGKKHSEITKEKMRKPKSKEHRTNISSGKKGIKSNRVWITNGERNTHISLDQLGVFLTTGWVLGKTVSDKTKEKQSASRKKYMQRKEIASN